MTPLNTNKACMSSQEGLNASYSGIPAPGNTSPGYIMPPPLIGGGIRRCFYLTSDVCLTAFCRFFLYVIVLLWNFLYLGSWPT